MNFISFIARQKVLANFAAIILSVVGLYLFAFSPKESLPEIKLGVILINTVYPGAGPSEVEKLVTEPIEDAVKNIKGIKEINSSSSESNSLIIISIEQSVTDTQALVNNIKNVVSKADGLPQEVNTPEVIEVTTDEFPILQVSVSGGKDYSELRSAARLLEDRVKKIDGVAGINKAGMLDRVIWVAVDREKLKEYGATIYSLTSALKSRNISVPAGTKMFDGKEYALRGIAEIRGAGDVEEAIIRANEAGYVTRVKDVAKVDEGFEEEQYKVRANMEPAVIFTVLKSRGADTITINSKVRALKDSLKGLMPAGIKINFANDSSVFIKDRIKLVNENGVLGALLVLATIVIFLRPSISFLAAISIPIVFGASLIVIKIMGLTYDMLSLFGFVMAIGIVVDSGIVVAENSYRYMRTEKDAMSAVEKGAGEVVVPVFASIMTTISSFLPLVFVGGVLGSFLRPIPVVIILTTVVSFFQAYLILPAQIAAFVKPSENKFTKWQDRLNDNMKAVYGKWLEIVLEKKAIVLSCTAALFVLSFFLGGLRGFSFFTTQVDEVVIKIKVPAVSSLVEAEKVMLEAEQKASAAAGGDLEAVYTFTGRQDGANSVPEIATNKGQINLVLKLESARKVKDINAVIAKVRESVNGISGADSINVSGVRREGGGARADIIVNITGNSYERIGAASQKAMTVINGVKGVKEVSSDLEQGKREYRFLIDDKKAVQANVTPAQVATALRAYVAGVEAVSIKDAGEDVEINVKAGNGVDTLEELLSLTVPTNRGGTVPLRYFVSVQEGYGYKSLRHKDTKKTVSITGSVDKKVSNNAAVNTEILKKLQDLKKEFPDVDFEAGGDFEDMMKSFRELGLAFLLAILLIYMILAALFNSLLQPLIMMAAIPLGFIGVMITLFVHGMPISFAAFMGFVALSGVVVNNSVVLNDFVNRLKAQKGSLKKAIVEACKIRLRPIILTAVTTIVGLLPLGYGLFGSNDAFLQPVALVFSWGLTFSTFVTLFIIPIFIYMLSGRKRG